MKYNADQFMLDFYKEDNGEYRHTELQKAECSAMNRTILFHYTSADTLERILRNKNLRFNRIDKVNDRLEHRLFQDAELCRLVFVSCFSIDKMESIPMWDIYGKNSDGLRIAFELDKPGFVQNMIDKQGDTITSPEYELYMYGKANAPNMDWTYTICMKDIIYDISAQERNPIRYVSGDTVIFNLTPMAAIKRKEWQYEHECRMITTLRTARDNVEAPNIDSIFVPITFEHIKSLTITFNPWMGDDVKCKVRNIVSDVPELFNKTSFVNSVLTGEIESFNANRDANGKKMKEDSTNGKTDFREICCDFAAQKQSPQHPRNLRR